MLISKISQGELVGDVSGVIPGLITILKENNDHSRRGDFESSILRFVYNNAFSDRVS